jgi:hypothetical protein
MDGNDSRVRHDLAPPGAGQVAGGEHRFDRRYPRPAHARRIVRHLPWVDSVSDQEFAHQFERVAPQKL